MVVKVTCDSVPLTLKNLPCGSHRGAPGYGLPREHNLRSMWSVLWALGQRCSSGATPKSIGAYSHLGPTPAAEPRSSTWGHMHPEPS